MSHEKLFLEIGLIQTSREKKERHTDLNLEQLTLGSGKGDLGMDREFKYGRMGQNMKDSGRITELMDLGRLHMLTRINTRESGQMIRQMEEEFTDIKMVRLTMDTGKRIFSTVKELRNGQMGVTIRESILKAKSTGTDNTFGQMARNTKENGLRTRSQDLESTLGLTGADTTESGSTTTWKA